jgi:hypothetical protein
MRIAFDLDGVLADLHTPFVQAAERLFPNRESAATDGGGDAESPDPDVPQIAGDVSLSPRQMDAVWREIANTSDFWETLDEIEGGSIARLAALTDERGWEVIFLTSRPRSKGRTVQRQTQRWLEAKGFTLPSVYVVHGSRGRVADALAIDVVVDDRPANCLDIVLESRAGALLVWRSEQAAVPDATKRLGIAVVPTVAGVLDALVEAERATEGGGTLAGRLRRLLGLKPPSAQSILK